MDGTMQTQPAMQGTPWGLGSCTVSPSWGNSYYINFLLHSESRCCHKAGQEGCLLKRQKVLGEWLVPFWFDTNVVLQWLMKFLLGMTISIWAICPLFTVTCGSLLLEHPSRRRGTQGAFPVAWAGFCQAAVLFPWFCCAALPWGQLNGQWFGEVFCGVLPGTRSPAPGSLKPYIHWKLQIEIKSVFTELGNF